VTVTGLVGVVVVVVPSGSAVVVVVLFGVVTTVVGPDTGAAGPALTPLIRRTRWA
jgi:hypothetical protein